MDNEGNVSGDLSHLRTVGVKDIVELSGYRLIKEDGVIRHSLKFKRGGSLEFAYTEEGELREFSGHALKIKISKENEVMIEGESEK